jgi:hypothetical protein
MEQPQSLADSQTADAAANIDRDAFHPPVRFVVLLTILASLIGLLLAVYLILTV